jgi:hypothetical protein
MRRWLKLWPLLILAVGMLTWPWVSAYIESKRGARYFRDKFKPGRNGYIVLSDDEWARLFGGHAGLGQLAALSRDSSLAPDGRICAAAIANYIRTGGYLRDLKSLEALADSNPTSYEWAISLRYQHFREWVFTLFA